MTGPVDDFLARADDVLTDWRGSADAMRWHPDGPDAIDDAIALPNLTGLAPEPFITVVVEDEAYALLAALSELAACECDQCTAWRARTPPWLPRRNVSIHDWEQQRFTGQDPRNDATGLRAALTDAAAAEPADEPADPRQHALDARRNRNTGPQPYRLDGHHR